MTRCYAVYIDKASQQSLLMARIGEEAYARHINDPHVLPMDFTGRPMKGYIYVKEDGIDMEADLEKWIQLALDFNPLAKSSKRKR